MKTFAQVLFVVLFFYFPGVFQSVLASEPGGISVTDFFSFCGFTYGDSCQDAVAVLGAPDERKVDSDGTHSYLRYFDKGLVIGCGHQGYGNMPDEKIESIYLKKAMAVKSLKSKGIIDKKLELYGIKTEQIISIMGYPKNLIKNRSPKYEYNDARRRLWVTIYCDEDGCDDFVIDWFDNQHVRNQP